MCGIRPSLATSTKLGLILTNFVPEPPSLERSGPGFGRICAMPAESGPIWAEFGPASTTFDVFADFCPGRARSRHARHVEPSKFDGFRTSQMSAHTSSTNWRRSSCEERSNPCFWKNSHNPSADFGPGDPHQFSVGWLFLCFSDVALFSESTARPCAKPAV